LTVLNKKSLHAVVEHLLLQGGNRLAIEAGASADQRLDYAALERRSRALAWALKARGIGPGGWWRCRCRHRSIT
jgi:non-ribosomal peptide synthetase component E (peptide arylation enzyme)